VSNWQAASGQSWGYCQSDRRFGHRYNRHGSIAGGEARKALHFMELWRRGVWRWQWAQALPLGISSFGMGQTI